MEHLANSLRRRIVDGTIPTETAEKWMADAAEKMGEQSGQTIGSASAHGISFAAVRSLTWDQWYALLDTVLHSITRNVKSLGEAQARF